jgi:hypothetical protein
VQIKRTFFFIKELYGLGNESQKSVKRPLPFKICKKSCRKERIAPSIKRMKREPQSIENSSKHTIILKKTGNKEDFMVIKKQHAILLKKLLKDEENKLPYTALEEVDELVARELELTGLVRFSAPLQLTLTYVG